MAIGWPEAIDGAPRRGLTAKEGFLASRGMTAQPAGDESSTPLLRHRRLRRSRPSARSGHWRGRLERSRHGQRTEKMAAIPHRQPASRQAHRLRFLPAGHWCCSPTLHRQLADRRAECSVCRRNVVLPQQRSNEGRSLGSASIRAPRFNPNDLRRTGWPCPQLV